jgi:tetratricopeptide (TPR) repeat protein
MKNSFRFLSIAAMNVMIASNVVYAHNIPSLITGEAQLKAGSDDLSKAYYSRGVAELALGATEAAKADFSKSIEVDPTPVDAQGFKQRGLAKSALGDIQGAKSDFTKAGSFGDTSVDEEINKNNG